MNGAIQIGEIQEKWEDNHDKSILKKISYDNNDNSSNDFYIRFHNWSTMDWIDDGNSITKN